MRTVSRAERYTRMTTAPVPGLVISLSVPTIISMLVTSLYNMADTYFVGKIGNSSTTGAIGVALSIMALIQAIGFTVGMGSGNYIAQLLGKKNEKMAERVAATGFFTVLTIGIIFMLGCLLFLEQVVRLLGATETIVPLAKEYIGIILLGAPFMASSFTLNNIIRYQGNAVYSMVGISIGGILNIILDPIFILGFDMGISGAAWATVISQIVSFSILLIACFTGNNIRIRLKNFTFRYGIHKTILRIGMPSFFRQGMTSIAGIFLNHFAGIYGGDAAVAAMTVVNKVFMFAYSILIGFAQGFQPVCGFNFGAGLYSRVKQAFFFCTKVGGGVFILFSIVAAIFAPQIIQTFRNEAAVIELGTVALYYQAAVFPLATWVVMCNMLLQSTGKSLRASILSVARSGICFIPAILILPLFLNVTGVLAAQPIADVFAFLIALPIGISAVKELSAASDKKTEPAVIIKDEN